MICKIIKKKGTKGSGGGRDAFAPGIRYGCEKAEQVRLMNLSCRSWHDAAEEMRLTSELSCLYQLYTYLRSQERPDDPASMSSEGMLLHPQTGGSVDEDMIYSESLKTRDLKG